MENFLTDINQVYSPFVDLGKINNSIEIPVLPDPRSSNVDVIHNDFKITSYDDIVLNKPASNSLISSQFSITSDENSQDSIIINNTIDQALSQASNLLDDFIHSSEYHAQMTEAFGSQSDQYLANKIIESGILPQLEIRSSSELNGAKGAFSKLTNTIYLSLDLVLKNANNTSEIVAVFTEEYGHFLDSKINTIETPGDEGEIFASLVQGGELSGDKLQKMKVEDDTAEILLDGKTIPVEKADVSWIGRIGGSGDWYDARNWSTKTVPTNDDSVTIESVGKNVTITFSKGDPSVTNMYLAATDKGTLTLKGLKSLSGNVDIFAKGSKSTIKLPNLTTFSGNDVYAPSYLSVENGGSIEANRLKNLENVQLFASNASLNLPTVETFTGVDDYVIEASSEGKINLGVKAITGDVDVNAKGSKSIIKLPNLTTFSGNDVYAPSYLSVENGGSIEANRLKKVENVQLFASNASLNLPTVETFTGVDDYVIEASSQGKINLTKLKTISGDVDISATGSNSIVKLPALSNFLGSDVYAPSSIISQKGGKVKVKLGAKFVNVKPLILG
ncbi:hypothetical protein L2E69_07345 [Planktothrix agardhii 1806]|uniref:hypothetical protein n=1 Tax=Planktothrix agardhii TaxID=1160 RepID=UPI001F26F075|nr:hypothetical protein [Planktothrix agardhii]MCF3569107.1 hypothetical protein [Planktothrix agardhii 1807]MCF3570485.1 hypothetical protein [Planktothrix agardhii 1805]MCF3603332.1 hypothetical protein [Planktothrix agardhii 1804]MCF3615760.1 hypothetical protein [Planktothrix agardhii 1806]